MTDSGEDTVATDHLESAGITDEKPKRSRLKAFLIRGGRLAVFGYAAVLACLVVMESRLVYPGAFMNVPSRDADGVKSVQYAASDGTQLTGELYEHAGAKHTLLYFHGNGITAARERPTIVRLGQQLNANVLAAEYRGYGDLDGSPNETGVIQDAYAARDFLCERYNTPANSLILYGQSLGGGCAVAVAGNSGAKLLILDRTFDRMVDVAAKKYWLMPIRLLMRNKYDSVERIQSYDGPIVQWHGKTDKLIPIQHGKNLHESAPTKDKVMLEIENMGHNDRLPDADWRRCKAAIQQSIDGS